MSLGLSVSLAAAVGPNLQAPAVTVVAPSYALVGVEITVSGTCVPATAAVDVTVNGETLGSTVGVGGAWSVTADVTYAMVGASVDVVATAGSALDTTTIDVIGPEYHWDRGSETTNPVPDPDTIAALHNQGTFGIADMVQTADAQQPEVGIDVDEVGYALFGSSRVLDYNVNTLTVGEITLFLALKCKTGAADMYPFADRSGSRRYTVRYLNSKYLLYLGGGANYAAIDTPGAVKAVLSWRWRASTGTVEAWVNGSPVTPSVTGTIPTATLPATYGVLIGASWISGSGSYDAPIYGARVALSHWTDEQIAAYSARMAADIEVA
jgi:hypothetical protein